MHCFGVFCRVCLEPKGNMTNIDGFCGGIHIGEMIFAVNEKLLNLDRLLPDLICPACKTELEIAYKFHKKCDRSVDILTDYVKKLDPQGFSGLENNSSQLKYYGLGSNITSKYQNRFENNDFAFKSYNQHNSRSLLFKIKRLRRENNNKTLKSKSKTQVLSHCLSDLSDFSLKKSNSNYSNTTVRLENLQDIDQFENKSSFIYDNKYSTTHMPLNKSDDSNISEKSIPISINSSSSSSKERQTISISYSPVVENDPEDEIDQKLHLEIGETSLNNNVSEYNRIKEEILNCDTVKIESPQRLNIISHEIVPCHLKYNLDLMELKRENDEVEKFENIEIKEENVEEMEELNCNEGNLKNELLDIVEHDVPYTLEDANFFKQELSQQKKVEKTAEEVVSATVNNETKESQPDKTDNVSTKETVEDKSSPLWETNKPRPLLQKTSCFLSSRYLCKYCDIPCHSAPGLKRHIYKFHFAKFNECKICLFTYRTRSELLEHVRTHKQWQYFPMSNRNRYNAFNNSAQINRRSFTCRVCKQIFWSQFEFSCHTRDRKSVV